MNPFIEILIFVVRSLTSVFLLFVILRFLLQLARANYYNPISRAIVTITNPLLIPLRKVIPGVFGIDMAAIVLALLVQVAFGEFVAVVGYQQFLNPLSLLAFGLLGTLKLTTYVGYVCSIVLVIASFVAPFSNHPALQLVRELMAPVLHPLQRIIPPVGGLDFSILFFFLGLAVVQKLLDAIAVSLHLITTVVIGY